jgi:hypothetical protein
MGGLGALVALRDKNMGLTLKAICEGGLTTQQYNLVKQLANAYDRNLSKQIANYQPEQKKKRNSSKSETTVGEVVDEAMNYGG